MHINKKFIVPKMIKIPIVYPMFRLESSILIVLKDSGLCVILCDSTYLMHPLTPTIIHELFQFFIIGVIVTLFPFSNESFVI